MTLTGRRCQCAACGECFNSETAFDRHRRGRLDKGEPRRCANQAELLARGWARNGRGFWIESAMPRRPNTVRVQGDIGSDCGSSTPAASPPRSAAVDDSRAFANAGGRLT